MVLLIFRASNANAQLQHLWSRRYSEGITNNLQHLSALVIGKDDSIYVSDHVKYAYNPAQTWLTIKYSTDGDGVWTNRDESETNFPNIFGPARLQVGQSNNVVVCGPEVVRIDSNGKSALARTITTASAITVNSNNDIYFALGGNNFGFGKIHGSTLEQFPSPPTSPGRRYSQAIAIDGAGTINVFGTDISINPFDPPPPVPRWARVIVVKYSPDGQCLETNLVGNEAHSFIEVADAATGTDGSIYLLCDCTIESSRRREWRIVKVSATMAEEERLRFPNSPTNFIASGLQCNAQGFFLTCKYQAPNNGEGFAVYGISTNWSFLWTNVYTPKSLSWDAHISTALGKSNLFVLCATQSKGPSRETVLAKYELNGALTWLADLSNSGTIRFDGASVSLDSKENILVQGYEVSNDQSQLVTRKYRQPLP